MSRAAWASDQQAPRVDSGAEGPAVSMSARCVPAAGSPLWRNQADGFPLPGKRTEALQTASLPPSLNLNYFKKKTNKQTKKTNHARRSPPCAHLSDGRRKGGRSPWTQLEK